MLSLVEHVLPERIRDDEVAAQCKRCEQSGNAGYSTSRYDSPRSL
ncbi:hypothetical protein [Mycobacteroides chelonae]